MTEVRITLYRLIPHFESTSFELRQLRELILGFKPGSEPALSRSVVASGEYLRNEERQMFYMLHGFFAERPQYNNLRRLVKFDGSYSTPDDYAYDPSLLLIAVHERHRLTWLFTAQNFDTILRRFGDVLSLNLGRLVDEISSFQK